MSKTWRGRLGSLELFLGYFYIGVVFKIYQSVGMMSRGLEDDFSIMSRIIYIDIGAFGCNAHFRIPLYMHSKLEMSTQGPGNE